MHVPHRDSDKSDGKYEDSIGDYQWLISSAKVHQAGGGGGGGGGGGDSHNKLTHQVWSQSD